MLLGGQLSTPFPDLPEFGSCIHQYQIPASHGAVIPLIVQRGCVGPCCNDARVTQAAQAPGSGCPQEGCFNYKLMGGRCGCPGCFSMRSG